MTLNSRSSCRTSQAGIATLPHCAWIFKIDVRTRRIAQLQCSLSMPEPLVGSQDPIKLGMVAQDCNPSMWGSGHRQIHSLRSCFALEACLSHLRPSLRWIQRHPSLKGTNGSLIKLFMCFLLTPLSWSVVRLRRKTIRVRRFCKLN